MSNIALLTQSLATQLVAALPLAARIAPDEDGDASIGHLLYTSDEEGGVEDTLGFHNPPLLDHTHRGGLWSTDTDTLTCHDRIALHKVRETALDTFTTLCSAIGTAAPVLGMPFLRFSLGVWKNRQGKLVLHPCFFADSPGMLHANTPKQLGVQMARMLRVLSPLDPPRRLFSFQPDSTPVPGYDAIQASMLYMVLAKRSTQLPSIAQARDMAGAAKALALPEEIEAGVARLTDRMSPKKGAKKART